MPCVEKCKDNELVSINSKFVILLLDRGIRKALKRLDSPIGIDMTREMVEKAKINADKLGIKNVEFRHGEIEYLPVEESSIGRRIKPAIPQNRARVKVDY